MREGVGIQSSLQWVAARFAQRAVEYFYESSAHREFVIDAAATVEFAAKAVIARHQVTVLFDVKGQPSLSSDQLFVLDPAGSNQARPSAPAWDEALDRLVEMETVSLTDAVGRADDFGDLDVDRSAAKRLVVARNRAIHIGDIDQATTDRLGSDFLTVCTSLWEGLSEPLYILWGDLEPIANSQHMRSDRGAKQEAQVRVVLARRHWYSFGAVGGVYRSHLQVTGDTVPCPACQNPAHISFRPTSAAPPECLHQTELDKPVETLECLFCGLTLFGARQIQLAIPDYAGGQEPHHLRQQ